MSWMDSWSRPAKSSAIPPPYYITHGDSVLYCHTCGRVISPRKSHTKPGNVIKYCSDRCRTRKAGAVDRKIESTIKSLLDEEVGSGIEKTNAKSKRKKGDDRNVITCDEIEQIVFGHELDPLKTFGRRKNRYSRAIADAGGEWRSVDMTETHGKDSLQRLSEEDVLSRTGCRPQPDAPMIRLAPVKGKGNVRPPQEESEMNFAAMGGERSRAEKILESGIDLQKRLEGQKRAEERELVRKAARRAVVFGLLIEEVESPQDSSPGKFKKEFVPIDSSKLVPHRRKCEAVMGGQVVEPSFAKGNWAIRWRE